MPQRADDNTTRRVADEARQAVEAFGHALKLVAEASPTPNAYLVERLEH